MKTRSPLQKKRLAAAMTQAEVAKAMDVSQPNYQRWESGAAPIPKPKLKKLAHVLHTSIEEVLGKKPPFDLFGIDDNIADARTYFGEVAVHFVTGESLLLPVSEAVRSRLYDQFQQGSMFIIVESLDNRIVHIRREAVTDIFFSSEAYDNYGPEQYSDRMGVFPDDDFWRVIEHMDSLDDLEDEVDDARIDEVLGQVGLSDDDLDQLIASGKVEAHDREKVKKEADEQTARFFDRATNIFWQLSSGKLRCERAIDSRVIFDAFSLMEIDPDDMDDVIHLPVESYHRTVMIRKPEIQFISIPKQLYKAGSMENAEDELDSP